MVVTTYADGYLFFMRFNPKAHIESKKSEARVKDMQTSNYEPYNIRISYHQLRIWCPRIFTTGKKDDRILLLELTRVQNNKIRLRHFNHTSITHEKNT